MWTKTLKLLVFIEFCAGCGIFKVSWLGVYSGFYYGSLNDQGSQGRYWSSTVNNATLAYYLYFDASNVYPAGSYSKDGGFAVRCVLG